MKSINHHPKKLILAAAIAMSMSLYSDDSRAQPDQLSDGNHIAIDMGNGEQHTASVAALRNALFATLLHKMASSCWSACNTFFRGVWGLDNHSIWRDIISSYAGYQVGFFNGVRINQPSFNATISAILSSGGPTIAAQAFVPLLVYTSRFYIQAGLAQLFMKIGFSANEAKWSSLLISLIAQSSVQTFVTQNVLPDAIRQVNNSARRQLLGFDNVKDFPPDEVGDFFRKLVNADIKVLPGTNLLVIPRIPGVIEVEYHINLPRESFDSFEGPVHVTGKRFGPSGMSYDFSMVISSAGYHMDPVKIVREGDKDWMLGRKYGGGFKVYHKGSSAHETRWNWVNHGSLIDMYPGPTNIWGIGQSRTIFRCPAPCLTGAWRDVGGEGVAIAVGRSYSGDMRVWVVGNSGKIFSRPENGTGSWTVTPNAQVPQHLLEKLYERDVVADINAKDLYHEGL